MLGLEGVRIERPEDIAPAWERAMSAQKPTVLEFVTDPSVPPLPPHVTGKDMKAYLSALLHGDPDAIRTVIASAKETWRSFFPGKG